MNLFEYFSMLVEQKNENMYVLYSDPVNNVRIEYPERSNQ